MVRYLLLFLLVILITRAAWRLVGGVMRGLAEHSQPRAGGGGVPMRGVQMVRDPVCGTYVLPDRALMLTDGSRQVFFCSAECRDKYRARPSTRSA